jgi:hypothetical protein
MSILKGFSPALIYTQLRSNGAASTFDRLLASQHVADLRLIFLCTFWMAVALVVVALIESAFAGQGFTMVGAVIAAAGAVMAWCYQAGSSRLGVVDLFGCEIATICRVCTVVDLVPRTINAYAFIKSDMKSGSGSAGPTIGAAMPIESISLNLESKESYEPVFDNNTRDLQVLDAPVVINVTQFYTYLKSMRDTWRKAGQSSTAEHRLAALRDVVYMQFLGFESARAAVHALIEYEPHEVDCTMIILLSEIPALAFLLENFSVDDFRHQRLLQRLCHYELILQTVKNRVTEKRKITKSSDEDWAKLEVTAKDLQSLYDRLLKPKVTAAGCDRLMSAAAEVPVHSAAA